MNLLRQSHITLWIVVVAWLASAAFKLNLSDTVVFDYDIVPVVSLGWDWLQGAEFPVHGTLSSVAAYNLPGLVWLHLPGLVVTGSPFLAIVVTLLWFNMLGTFAAYALGREIGDNASGAVAAILFAFSETSISASVIAWAQLLLPTFFVLVALCLFRWWRTGDGRWMLAAGVLSIFAFMTHFSAVLLLPICVVFWILSGAVVRWRWAMGLVLMCALLMAPYLTFQSERNFRDVRAFLTRTVQVPPEVFTPIRAEAARLAREQARSVNGQVTAPASNDQIVAPDIDQGAGGRLVRFIARIPNEVLQVLRAQTQFTPRPSAEAELMGGIWVLTTTAWRLLILAMSVVSLAVLGQRILIRRRPRALWWQGVHGRFALLASLPVALLIGLLILRVYPTQQPTYLAGVVAWMIILAAVGLVWVLRLRLGEAALLKTGIVIAWGAALLSVVNYTDRLNAQADQLFPQGWYYNTLLTVADAIHQRVGSDTEVAISYELWPQQRGFDWVPAWGWVDSDYRQGMALDFVLRAEHGIINTNRNLYGYDPEARFVVRFAPDAPTDGIILTVNQMVLSEVN